MCNAWGHSAGCTCGWGGDGHSGKSGNQNHPTWDLYYHRGKYPSYTNPNAKCPVCGVKVFYYQSPSGGRVFFDNMAPPWPKHPCTDNKKGYKVENINYVNINFKKALPWEVEGWEPAIIISIGRLSQFHVELEIVKKSGRKFIDTITYDFDFIERVKKDDLLLFYKDSGNKEFELNYFDLEKGEAQTLSMKEKA